MSVVSILGSRSPPSRYETDKRSTPQLLAYYCDTFVLPLPEKHRFPMLKYRLLREALISDPELGTKVKLCLPPAATDEQLLRVHTSDYLGALLEGRLDPRCQRRIGFPYSPEMVERSRRSVGATISACEGALRDRVSVNLAGGTHHAFADRGEGFCVFNDTAVALHDLKARSLIQSALVIDTDVHQGNGTAAVLADSPEFFTLSIHGEKNFPFRKERSDLDVALPDGTGDADYLASLADALSLVEERFRPEFVLFQSGADPYEKDKLGRLSLSLGGLARRDRMVLDWCQARNLPVAVTMGGGYAPQVEEIVAIHLQTVRAAFALFQRRVTPVL